VIGSFFYFSSMIHSFHTLCQLAVKKFFLFHSPSHPLQLDCQLFAQIGGFSLCVWRNTRQNSLLLTWKQHSTVVFNVFSLFVFFFIKKKLFWYRRKKEKSIHHVCLCCLLLARITRTKDNFRHSGLWERERNLSIDFCSFYNSFLPLSLSFFLLLWLFFGTLLLQRSFLLLFCFTCYSALFLLGWR
jgi:hypothetical protein